MSVTYTNFVTRLSTYRKAHGLSQAEMGKLFNLTQSHYNKIENMSKIMSYNSLVFMKNKDLSVDFLVTGIEPKYTILNDLLLHCNELEKADFIHMAVICMELALKYQGNIALNDLSLREIEILRADMENKNNGDYSVWKTIRTIDGLTQERIAKYIDVDIKTYREIEKGNSKPNAEILSLLYEKLGYPPSIILGKEDKNYLFVVNEIWLKLPMNLQHRISDELNSFLEYIKSLRAMKN